MITLGIPKESNMRETRVSGIPETVKRLCGQGVIVQIETGAGENAYFRDADYELAGAKIVSHEAALASDVVFKINAPTNEEIPLLKKGALLCALLNPLAEDNILPMLASRGINAVALEMIPRITRAQSMDVLSSQAGVGGYRAVLEAAIHYPRFFPLMMTSAGTAKPAKVLVLGAGVAGLAAIATAKRLGAQVEAFDVRPETKDQVESLGAKFVQLDLGEEGRGEGGYAKELSQEAQAKQQALLAEVIRRSDMVITTAQVPGKRAPVLIPESVVAGMRVGSVIVDMAAASGGNCPLSKADEIIVQDGVTLVGITNFPALVPYDASAFFARNLYNLIALFISEENGQKIIHYPLEDEIVAKALVVFNGENRLRH